MYTTVSPKKIMVILFVLFTTHFTSCRTSQTSSEEKLVGGTISTGKQFPSTLIWTAAGTDILKSYCTATKVGRRLLLTAAHCVLAQNPLTGNRYIGPWHTQDSMKPGSFIKISFDRVVTAQSRIAGLPIAAVHLHPHTEKCLQSKSSDDHTCIWRTPLPDIAVIELAELNGDHSNDPFRQAPTAVLSYELVLPGSEIIMGGYGANADPGDQNADRRIALRMGHNKVASAIALMSALKGTDAEVEGYPDWHFYFGALGSWSQYHLPNLGSGDSGGPVFAQDGTTIVGINSDGHCPKIKPNCERTSQSVFARLDSTSGFAVGRWLKPLIER